MKDRPDLAVKVEPAAGRKRQPGVQSIFVLAEERRRGICIIEAWQVARPICVHLQSRPPEPGLAQGVAAQTRLGLAELLAIPILIRAVDPLVLRAGERSASEHEMIAADEEVSDHSPIKPLRVEGIAER